VPFQFDKHSATLKHDTPGPGVDQPPNDLAGAENLHRASNATPSCVLSQSLDADMAQQPDWTKQAMPIMPLACLCLPCLSMLRNPLKI